MLSRSLSSDTLISHSARLMMPRALTVFLAVRNSTTYWMYTIDESGDATRSRSKSAGVLGLAIKHSDTIS